MVSKSSIVVNTCHFLLNTLFRSHFYANKQLAQFIVFFVTNEVLFRIILRVSLSFVTSMPVLHEYLTKLHDTSLSTEEKMRIYQRYLDKSHRVLLRRKVAYYSRVTVFSLATLVLFAGGFYLFMPGNSPYVMNELDSGLVALQQKNGAYVHAEPVGRIITARGDIVITNAEGEQIDGSDIHSNDTILLQAGGEILLTVSNGFQAKII